MRQKCLPLPHRQPQVNVMDLCFCIKDLILNVNETSLFRKTKQMIYIHLLKYCPNIIFILNSRFISNIKIALYY